MLMPSIFGENLLDRMFSFPFESDFYNRDTNLMKTDIKENDNEYELQIDLPGYNKEDVSAKLEQGYLTIHASKQSENEQKAEDGKYIRRERYAGHCSRSFYVGDNVKQEDIKAKFEDGTLKLAVPKKEVKKVEQNSNILIEG